MDLKRWKLDLLIEINIFNKKWICNSMKDFEEFVDFDSMAKTYDETRGASIEILNILNKELLSLIPKEYIIKDILEIGCGTGRVSKIFATSGFNLVGIDASHKMLDIAIKKASLENWKFEGKFGDARKLPFVDKSFDLIYCVNLLHLIKDWKKVISEVQRVSKNSIFANISLNQDIKGKLWDKFLTKVSELRIKYNEQFKIENETIIGARPQKVLEYMKNQNYKVKTFKATNITTENKTSLIKGLGYKDISTQRFVPNYIHAEALKYLEENEWFMEEFDNKVDLEEKLLLHVYFKES